VPDGVALPRAELVEPNWHDTFKSPDDPTRRAVNTRCRKVASREWRRIVPVLELTVGLADVDTAVLTDYCVAVARIDQCEREISETGLLVRGERGWQKNGAATIATQYRAQLACYVRELGLSPSARTGLAPPEQSDHSDIWD
jgi:P27 family predicted phage terminase small subunit